MTYIKRTEPLSRRGKNVCACGCGEKKRGPNAFKRRFIPGHNQTSKLGKRASRGLPKPKVTVYPTSRNLAQSAEGRV